MRYGALQGFVPRNLGQHMEQILLSGFFKPVYRIRIQQAPPFFGFIILINRTGRSVKSRVELSSPLPTGEHELGSGSQLHPLPPPPDVCGLRKHSLWRNYIQSPITMEANVKVGGGRNGKIDQNRKRTEIIEHQCLMYISKFASSNFFKFGT